MIIFPGMHYSMGGVYVTFEPGPNLEPLAGSPKNQATSIPGLYASGEADHAYHGANRLGANSLLSCIYGGMIGGPAMVSYAKNVAKSSTAVPSSVFEDAKKQWEERFASIDKMSGTENPYVLARELGEVMTENVTVVRRNDRLRKTLDKIAELKDRWKRINVLDHGHSSNRPAELREPALEHVRPRRGDHQERAAPRRVARRPLQAGVPAPRAEDQGPHPGPGLDEGLEGAPPEVGARPPSPAGLRRARRSRYEDIPTPVLDPEPRWYA